MRLGCPKQLLPYRGKSLIQHVVEVAIASVCDPVLVVVGANGDRMQAELDSYPMRLVHNADWQQGMATSIRAGITALQTEHADIAAVVLMVCDQPLVSTSVINQLVEQYQQGDWRIVASDYAGLWGVPALFDRSLFIELSQLQGDTGARKIIQTYRGQTGAIANPAGAIDVDTLADYQRLIESDSSAP